MKQLVMALGVVAVASAVAHAEDTAWSQGVAKADQDRANKLYEQGNQLFVQQRYAPALEKYRAALAIWDHPQIQLNTAVTLIRLERPLDAAAAIERALRFDAKPFAPEDYQKALDYQSLLKNQVGTITARCTQDGATVSLDGKPWFACAGSATIRVSAGEHTLVAEGKAFATQPYRVVVAGGSAREQAIQLKTLEEAVTLEYPYARWLPWTVAGVGAAIAVGGVGFYLAGRNQMNEFEDNFASDCAMGCEADLSQHPALRDQRDGAKLQGSVGITLMIAGGAATIGGVVLAILNRPERVMPQLEVAPTAGGIQAGATFRW